MRVSITIVLLSYLFYCSESKISLFYNNEPKYPFDLKEIFDSLFLSKTICIWSTKVLVNERTENLLSQIYTFHNYSITNIKYGHGERLINATQCMNNIVFNFDYFYYRVLFKDGKPCERHVFLIIDTLGTNVEGVKKLNVEMFKILWIAKIVLLTEYQVYKFSSAYFPPRRLEKIESLADLNDERITDLRGRVVNIATFNCSLFSIIQGPMNSGVHDGIEMRMMQQLAIQLNMTPNYINAGGWGWMFDNGTWNGGLAGMLQDGKAEIGYCNIWNTLRYNRVVALAPQWSQMYYTFMVPRPVMIHGYWMTIVTLFHRTVWILLLMICLLVTILFWKYQKSQQNNSLSDLVESLLTVSGTFLGQSTHLPPCYAFGQRIIVTWSIFSFFMASILNNMMISRLMVPHQSERIDTVKDFVLGGYHWGEEAFSNFQQEIYFNTKDPWHKKMENQFQPIPRDQIMSALRSRKMALPVQRLGNEYVFITQRSIDQSELDNFRIMKETINQFYVSLIFSKLSPMLEICRYPILRFAETGLILHWKNEVIRKHGSVKAVSLLFDPHGESVGEFEPLTIANNLAAFQILLYGWCVSLIVFLIELFNYRKLRVRKFKTISPKTDEPFTPYFYCE